MYARLKHLYAQLKHAIAMPKPLSLSLWMPEPLSLSLSLSLGDLAKQLSEMSSELEEEEWGKEEEVRERALLGSGDEDSRSTYAHVYWRMLTYADVC